MSLKERNIPDGNKVDYDPSGGTEIGDGKNIQYFLTQDQDFLLCQKIFMDQFFTNLLFFLLQKMCHR